MQCRGCLRARRAARRSLARPHWAVAHRSKPAVAELGTRGASALPAPGALVVLQPSLCAACQELFLNSFKRLSVFGRTVGSLRCVSYAAAAAAAAAATAASALHGCGLAWSASCWDPHPRSRCLCRRLASFRATHAATTSSRVWAALSSRPRSAHPLLPLCPWPPGKQETKTVFTKMHFNF